MEKPVFLTKAQREEQKRKQEEEKKRLEEEQKLQNQLAVQEYLKKGKEEIREIERKRREEERNRRERYRQRRHKKSRSRSRSRERTNTKVDQKSVPMSENEIEHLKKQYLGINKEKKKIQKPSEKFHTNFVFEWDESEDTSKDVGGFYASRHDPHLLFGKGRIGGVDPALQKESFEAALARNGKEGREEARLIKDDKKNIHWSKKPISEMTSRDWRIFREDNDISLKGSKAPLPFRNWNESNLPDYIMRALERAGYMRPTEIQMQGIPVGIERKDMIGVAPTGSGKSCAYLVPLICCLASMPPLDEKNYDDGPRGMILTPTRELAIQVEEEFRKLAHYTKLTSALVVGGRSAEEQSFTLSRGSDVLIGTPGRINEFLQKRFLVLNQCFYVVLDEGDVMIDLGFEEDVNKILEAIAVPLKGNTEEEVDSQITEMKSGDNIYRVTHLFSATMPQGLEKLAKKYLKCPVVVTIGRPGSGKKEIEQRIVFATPHGKKQELISILEDSHPPIMVFVNQKKDIDNLARYISNFSRLRCATLHSDKTQEKRERALTGFKSGTYDVLVCTNLASRGLDIEGITHVINYDAPNTISDYTHRIGRTGRAGKKGTATTFLTNNDQDIFYDLRNYLAESGQKIPAELNEHPAAHVKPVPGGKKSEPQQQEEDANKTAYNL